MKRPRERGLAALAVAASLWGAGVLPGAEPAPDTVAIRGSAEPIAVRIEGVTAAGVLVRIPPAGSNDAADAAASLRVISWDQIRKVTGAKAGDALAFAPLGEALWRGRARVERGDFGKASDVVEPLYTGAGAWANGPRPTGPSLQVLAECVLRTRLAQGWSTGAVFAWLDWAAAQRQANMLVIKPKAAGWMGGTVSAAIDGRAAPMVDRQLALCPWLPPIYSTALGGKPLDAFVSRADWERVATDDDAVTDLANLYRFAARFELGLRDGGSTEIMGVPKVTSEDPAVRLVADIVTARAGSPDQRAGARERLRRQIAGSSQAKPAAGAGEAVEAGQPGDSEEVRKPWREAWCRLAIGRSLLREPSVKDRRLGVIELLHLPARLADVVPSLTAMALADAAAELERMGDASGARQLRMELAKNFPDLLDQSEPAAKAAPAPPARSGENQDKGQP